MPEGHNKWKCKCDECRKFVKEYRRNRRKEEWAKIKADPEKLKKKYEKALEWRTSNSGKQSVRRSSRKSFEKSYANNKEDWKRRSRQWTVNNLERVNNRRKDRSYDKRYLENNPQNRKESVAKYAKNHREEYNARFIKFMESGGLEKYKGTYLENRYEWLKLPPELRKAKELLAKARKSITNKSVPS